MQHQKVSAPVALILIALVIALSVIVFSKPNLVAYPEREVIPIPFSPPFEDSDARSLRKELAPLGILAIMPPTTEDRFQGARIAGVYPGSPAAEAGLKPGDLITEFNDIKVASPFEVVAGIRSTNPEARNSIKIIRAGEELEFVVTGVRPLALEERVL